jgi:hypothetical protein
MGRELTQCIGGPGYYMVSLRGTARITVHTLIAEAFLGPRPEKHDINHIDGNKLNNRADNLEYVTRARNIEHARQTGLMGPSPRGEQSGAAKLTEEQVRAIRKRLAEGASHRRIAREFGVSRGPIGAIARNQIWRHVCG